jgi:hypothetical protein
MGGRLALLEDSLGLTRSGEAPSASKSGRDTNLGGETFSPAARSFDVAGIMSLNVAPTVPARNLQNPSIESSVNNGQRLTINPSDADHQANEARVFIQQELTTNGRLSIERHFVLESALSLVNQLCQSSSSAAEEQDNVDDDAGLLTLTPPPAEFVYLILQSTPPNPLILFFFLTRRRQFARARKLQRPSLSRPYSF